MSRRHERVEGESELGAQRKASSRRRGAGPAVRTFEQAFPVPGTLGDTYLRSKGIDPTLDVGQLRFHPHYFIPGEEGVLGRPLPALFAAVRDATGELKGVYRSWLAPHGKSLVEVPEARRGLGDLRGNGVWFGAANSSLFVTSSIEAGLALRAAMPKSWVVCAPNAGFMETLVMPEQVRKVYVTYDQDPDLVAARVSLMRREREAGRAIAPLQPRKDDYCEDVQLFGLESVRKALHEEIEEDDKFNHER